MHTTVFGNIDGAKPGTRDFTAELQGIIGAAYSLGAIISLPLVGVINDWLGRRWSIFLGSGVMVIGALVQGFSINGM